MLGLIKGHLASLVASEDGWLSFFGFDLKECYRKELY